MTPLQPVFVVGNVHSGTTLVQKILGRNSAVFTGSGETQFFFHLSTIRSRFPTLRDEVERRDFIVYLCNLIIQGYQRTQRLPISEEALFSATKSLTPQDLKLVTAAIKDTKTLEQAFFRVYDVLCVQHNKSHWIEKTPAHIFSADTILQEAPSAKFVEIVRDPRSVLASKQRRSSANTLR